jgi:hypothetical protein
MKKQRLGRIEENADNKEKDRKGAFWRMPALPPNSMDGQDSGRGS